MFAQWRHVNDVLAQLGHPVFLPALDMGYSGDSFWQIVPVVAGQNLSQRLHSVGPIQGRDAAALVAELSEALQLAHAQGLVHGDLKPGHILLGDDGQIHVVDFGELPLRAADSRPESMVGTPAYMAPERVRGEDGPVDPQCEVYALGVILYEMITGLLPFAGASIAEVFAAILKNAPKPPRKVVRSIPAALESICLKAIAKDRAVRYATAGEFAAALRGFLAPARRKGFWKST